MSGIKLFVGGLSYSTGAEVLGKLFETVGIVKSATIATNENNQSRGHGFVEMETPELALFAVNKLNGYVLEGRAIHVHVYRESPSEGGLGGRGRGRGRGAFGAGFQGIGVGRGGFRGGLRGRGLSRGFPANEGAGTGFVNNNFQNNFGGGFQGAGRGGFQGVGVGRGGFQGAGRGGFQGVGVGRGGFQGVGAGRGGFPGVGAGRGFRAFGAAPAAPFIPRPFVPISSQRGRGFIRRGFGGGFAPRRIFDSNAPLSKTRVYVRNIPFDLSSQDLEAVFTEKGFNIKEVSIAQRRFNTSVNRGFGFVEFASEDEQGRALKELGTVTIKERPCQIMAARPIPERPVAATGGAADPANTTAATGEGAAEGGSK